MSDQKITRMAELVRKLNDASHAYYVLDNPYISDMQWDQMYDELRKLESETGTVLEDSPSRHVGGAETLRGFEEHRHITRLWSLDKVQSIEDLDAWILRTEKLAGRWRMAEKKDFAAGQIPCRSWRISSALLKSMCAI